MQFEREIIKKKKEFSVVFIFMRLRYICRNTAISTVILFEEVLRVVAFTGEGVDGFRF